MTLTFTSPEWAIKITKLWKKYKAPVYLRKTEDPSVRSVCVRPNVDSIVANLFVINACFAPESQKKVKRLLLRKYTAEVKECILAKVAKYDFIVDIAKKDYDSNPV